MNRSDRSPAALPPERAFVVQFSADANLAEGRALGRAEHVCTGRTVHFTAMDQLVAFLDELMSAQQEATEPTERSRA